MYSVISVVKCNNCFTVSAFQDMPGKSFQSIHSRRRGESQGSFREMDTSSLYLCQ